MTTTPEQAPFPTLPITSKETLRKCRQLSVGSNDIFICSFPKSGTTWMQNIVFQLLAAQRLIDNTNKEELPFGHISQYVPFFEIDPHWNADETLIDAIQEAHQALGSRVFNTHLRWDMMPQGAKYIYVTRDGRDVLTSFYHHMTNQDAQDGGFEGDYEAFLQDFLDGKVAFGKWTHHLASWMSCFDTSHKNILFVRYEDLKSNLLVEIQRIAAFLEIDLDQNITLDSHTDSSVTITLQSRVMERISFEYMRENQSFFHPISVRWKPGYHFIRKGVVGDHTALMTDSHLKRFKEAVLTDFHNNPPSFLHHVMGFTFE